MTNKLPPYFEQYLDQKFGEVNARLDAMTKAMSAEELRVSCLESWKSEITGKLAIITFIIVLGVNMMLGWIREKLKLF